MLNGMYLNFYYARLSEYLHWYMLSDSTTTKMGIDVGKTTTENINTVVIVLKTTVI